MQVHSHWPWPAWSSQQPHSSHIHFPDSITLQSLRLQLTLAFVISTQLSTYNPFLPQFMVTGLRVAYIIYPFIVCVYHTYGFSLCLYILCMYIWIFVQ